MGKTDLILIDTLPPSGTPFSVSHVRRKAERWKLLSYIRVKVVHGVHVIKVSYM